MCRFVVCLSIFCLQFATSFALALVQSSQIGLRLHRWPIYSQVNDVDESIVFEQTSIDPKKEAVKIFGRLAEKYIALDSSGGNCCYSACTDCEYRLPGGGYIMADQSASRPKWIPHYESRTTNNREHVTKWSASLFVGAASISKKDFSERLISLEYSPPLGGPYLSASMAAVEDLTTVHRLFDIVAQGKEEISKRRMSIRLKQLSDGEEGMTWQSFERIMIL
jgi:hypothetical protein